MCVCVWGGYDHTVRARLPAPYTMTNHKLICACMYVVPNHHLGANSMADCCAACHAHRATAARGGLERNGPTSTTCNTWWGRGGGRVGAGERH